MVWSTILVLPRRVVVAVALALVWQSVEVEVEPLLQFVEQTSFVL